LRLIVFFEQQKDPCAAPTIYYNNKLLQADAFKEVKNGSYRSYYRHNIEKLEENWLPAAT
jgi:hypothetical protein